MSLEHTLPAFSDAPPLRSGNSKSETTGLAHPELLISVRNSSEFDAVLACDVDIIDLKEPRNGALAPANPSLLRHAAETLCSRKSIGSPLSAALGERDDSLRVAGQIPTEFAFAKVGPSDCRDTRSLCQLWTEVRERLAATVELVAVAYADEGNADCLAAPTVFEIAAEAGFNRCLIDTFDKDGRSTRDHLGIPGLNRIHHLARDNGMWWALAGSIRLADVAELWDAGVQPNCFGVRGDVCSNDRVGVLSVERVRAWQAALVTLKVVIP